MAVARCLEVFAQLPTTHSLLSRPTTTHAVGLLIHPPYPDADSNEALLQHQHTAIVHSRMHTVHTAHSRMHTDDDNTAFQLPCPAAAASAASLAANCAAAAYIFDY